MSTYKSKNTSQERAKTSLGLKSSNRERMESVSELMVALEQERQMEQVMMKSVEQWTEIVNEITTNMDSATTSESEWKTRFHDQRLFNQMLTQEIGHIKTELFMLKQGHAGLTLPVMGEPKTSNYCRQSQTYIDSLEKKLKSLQSLYNMYEHQLDETSRDYHRLKEEINKIVKDVSYKQKAMIKRQEESDKKKISESNLALKPPEKVTTLPPLKGVRSREKTSYLKLHEEKSVTSKNIVKGKQSQPKTVGGNLSVRHAFVNTKNKEKMSKKTKNTFVVQEEWKRVTRKDVLPPLFPPHGSANSNREEDNKSAASDKEKVKKNRNVYEDSKLPSMRSKRIANLGSGNDYVSLPPIRKVKKPKEKEASPKGFVGNDEDHCPGSTAEVAHSEKGTEQNTIKPKREKSRIQSKEVQQNGNNKPLTDKEKYSFGVDPKTSTKAPIKSALKNTERNACIGEHKRVSYESQSEIKSDNVPQSPQKNLREVSASPQEHSVSEHEYQLPAGNDDPKPSRERLKSAFMRSNSRSSSSDNRKKSVSPVELQRSPSAKDSPRSDTHRDSVSPLSVTSNNRKNTTEETSRIETGRNSSERRVRSRGKASKDPGPKRKSVTINEKTTVHFP